MKKIIFTLLSIFAATIMMAQVKPKTASSQSTPVKKGPDNTATTAMSPKLVKISSVKGITIGDFNPASTKVMIAGKAVGTLELSDEKYFARSVDNAVKGYFFPKGTEVFDMVPQGGGISVATVTYEDNGKTINITYKDGSPAIRVLENANGFIEIWYNNKLAGRATPDAGITINSETAALIAHYFLREALLAAIK